MTQKTKKDIQRELGESIAKMIDRNVAAVVPQRQSNEAVSNRLRELLDQFRGGDDQDIIARVYKQDERTQEYGLFVTLSFKYSELKEKSPETICLEQGGRGAYKVGIVLPDGHEEKFGPYRTWGLYSYDAPLAERVAAQQGTLPPGALPQTGQQFAQQLGPQGQVLAAQSLQPVYPGDPSKYFAKTTDRLLQNAENQDNKFLNLLLNQQAAQQTASDKNSQLITNMFAGLIQLQEAKAMASVKQGGSESDSKVKELEQKIERMEQQRRDEERFNSLLKASEDKYNALAKQIEAGAKKDEGGGAMKAVVEAFGLVSNMQTANNQMQADLMRSLTDKSGQQDFLLKMSQHAMDSSMKQVDMVRTLIEAGLLGEQAPNLKDYVKQALGFGAQIVKGLVANPAMGMQQQPPQLVEAGAMGYLPPDESGGEEQQGEEVEGEEEGQVVEQQQQAQVQSRPQAQAPARQPRSESPLDNLLTAEELDLVERDSALAKIVAVIANGGSVAEASQRIFIHARSKNRVALKWISNPVAITAQVLLHYGVTEDRIDEAHHDLVAYINYLNSGGAPDEWAGTGYRSQRPPYRMKSYEPPTVAPMPVAAPAPAAPPQPEAVAEVVQQPEAAGEVAVGEVL